MKGVFVKTIIYLGLHNLNIIYNSSFGNILKGFIIFVSIFQNDQLTFQCKFTHQQISNYYIIFNIKKLSNVQCPMCNVLIYNLLDSKFVPANLIIKNIINKIQRSDAS